MKNHEIGGEKSRHDPEEPVDLHPRESELPDAATPVWQRAWQAGNCAEQYQLLFDSNPQPLMIYAMDTLAILEVNQAMVRHYGYSREEFLSMTIKDIRSPEEIPDLLQLLPQLPTGAAFNPAQKHRKKDGSIIDVEISSQEIIFDGKEARLVLAADVTERRRVEATLRESEERFRTLATIAPIGIYLTDIQGQCQYVNQRWCDMSGLTGEEARGEGWMQGLHPEDRELVRSSWDKMVRSAGDWELEYRFRTPDGKVTWVSGRAAPMRNRRGELVGYVGTNSDITDRKRFEELQRVSLRFLEIINEYKEIQALLDAFVAELQACTACEAVGIRVLDAQGMIPYLAYEGFSQSFYDLESPLSIRSDRCMCINVIKGDFNPDLPFYTAGGSFYMNGTTRFLSTVSEQDKGQTRNVCNQVGYESVALIPLRRGQLILGLIHLADKRENMVPLHLVEILEKAGMQLAIAFLRVQAEAALKTSLREKEVLLKEIYHRTKNNLQVVCSLLKLQSCRFSDPQLLGAFEDTGNRIRSMALVHEKLYQAQDLSHIDLKDYIKDLANSLLANYQTEYGNVSLHLDLHSVIINIDTAMPCGLVLNELVSNAIKYAFPGGRRGTISIMLKPQEDGGLELRVADDGVGLPSDLDVWNTDSLGLKLVINLATSQLQGKLTVRREQGTEFRIIFRELDYKPRI